MAAAGIDLTPALVKPNAYIYISAYIHTYIHISACIHTYIHTCIHTYTHA